MPEKKKRRIEIYDIAKCIAIFMVILGHTATNDELLADPPMLIRILYSIHMPLFFMLSGLSISPVTLKGWAGWKLFLRKTVLTVAIPFLIWGLIYCRFSFENLGWILYGSWTALGRTGTVTSLWYLSCLFCARILAQLVISAMTGLGAGGRRTACLLPAALCLAVGFLLPEIENGYPWCLDVAFTATGCILLGVALRDRVLRLQACRGWVLAALLIGACGLYGALAALSGERFGVMMMCRGAYGNPFLAVAFAGLGGFAVIVLSVLLKRLADEWIPRVELKPLVYLGQHTMGVFLLHKPMLQNVFLPFFTNLLSGGPDILVRLLATFASLLVSVWLCRLIEHYIPELVGIFSKDVIRGRDAA